MFGRGRRRLFRSGSRSGDGAEGSHASGSGGLSSSAASSSNYSSSSHHGGGKTMTTTATTSNADPTVAGSPPPSSRLHHRRGRSGGGGGNKNKNGKMDDYYFYDDDEGDDDFHPLSGGGEGRNRSGSSLGVEMRSRPPPLSDFDACVEACDALAASGGNARRSSGVASSPRSRGGGGGGRNDDDNDAASSRLRLPDCSVLVSPDGALLFLPVGGTDGSGSGSLRSGSSHGDLEGGAKPKSGGRGWATLEEERSATLPTKNGEAASPASTPATSPTGAFGAATAMRTTASFFPGEEYGAAIVVGNDLVPGGDRASNGFSGRGWNPSAATVALRRGEAALRATGSFVEDLILSRKESAMHAIDACDRLRNQLIEASGGKSSSDGDAGGGGPRSGSGSGSGRVGPLLHSGSTLHAALEAVEQYHTRLAEDDAGRWRAASSSHQRGGSESGVGSGNDISLASLTGILPAIRSAADRAARRAADRERALYESEMRLARGEMRLAQKKAEAAARWDDCHDIEDEVTRRIEMKILERSRERERRRQAEENEKRALDAVGQLDTGATAQEIWELVAGVAESMEAGSFAPTGLPFAPNSAPKDQSLDSGVSSSSGDGASTSDSSRPPSPPLPMASRTEVEEECGLPQARLAALAASEAVEDAAGALLNLLSKLDTTRRSARIAAEGCLMSECLAQESCLRSLVALERASVEERLRRVIELESFVNEIDIRNDLDRYIEADKRERGGTTRLGDDDDGGVASGLAVLNSHSEGMGLGIGVAGTSSRGTTSILMEGWGASDDESDSGVASPEEIEESLELLFETDPLLSDSTVDGEDMAEDDIRQRQQKQKACEDAIVFLVNAVGLMSSRGRGHRQAACYALNNQRSVKTEVDSEIQFDGLCRVFDALLSGCDRESGDVASAKMCMMLAQTFYIVKGEDVRGEKQDQALDTRSDRKKRIFVKNRLIRHPLWSDEDFWDQALFQCVSESLTKSGVMMNFERLGEQASDVGKSNRTRKLKWHDLNPDERSEAASQVHAVVFAQLGALAHSMVEYGCGIDQACAFVRRLSIRHQLPMSQRTMLLQHLLRDSSIKTVPEETDSTTVPDVDVVTESTQEETARDPETVLKGEDVQQVQV